MAESPERNPELESITNKSLMWLDIQKPTREKLMKLSKYPFHELNIDDCLSKIRSERRDSYDDHVFVILNFAVIEKDRHC